MTDVWTTQWPDVVAVERERVPALAEQALGEPVVGITDLPCPHSPGGAQDYYSQAAYWWPDPNDPAGPYINRDGLANPDRFTAHASGISRLSRLVTALAAGCLLAGEARFAERAAEHLRRWFIEPESRMNPHLRFGQAIPGRCTGRGIGIIDTKHLVEVVLAIPLIEQAGALDEDDVQVLRDWFRHFLVWLTTDDFGLDERKQGNNHAIYWAVQVAAFARFVGEDEPLAMCRDQYRETFLPEQMATDGSLPCEVRRTRSLGYSIFSVNGLAALCTLLSTPDCDLWQFALPDGRGMARAMNYLYPALVDPAQWPHGRDVEGWDEMPGRPIALLLAGVALNEPRYLDQWKRLAEPAGGTDWSTRAVCFRQPLLWLACHGETLAT